MNRLKEFFNQPPDPESGDNYWEVDTEHDSFAVSREVAEEIERLIDELHPPRWLVFRDLTGARHRVLTAQVHRISECTEAQRAARREFYRARRREEKTDRRPWEEED